MSNRVTFSKATRFTLGLVWLPFGCEWQINRWNWRQCVYEPLARVGPECVDRHVSIIKRIIKLIEIYIADVTSLECSD